MTEETSGSEHSRNPDSAVDSLLVDELDRRLQAITLRNEMDVPNSTQSSALQSQVDVLARRLNSLVEASHKIIEPLSLNLVLTRLVSLLSEAFDADRSTLFLYDQENHELFSRIAEGEDVSEIRFAADSGIAGAAFQSGESFIINDAYRDNRFNADIDTQTGYRTSTILCVPVRSRNGEIVGVAEVLNKRDGAFTDSDSTLLRAFTTHIATALENVQLTERARVSMREESRIMEVTQAISSELDIDQLLRKIMRIASELLSAERSTLFLYDPTRDELWSRVAEGMEQKEIRIPANAGIAGQVFVSRAPVNIPDAYDDPRFNRSVDLETGFRTRSILCVPVIDKHGVALGVVQVLNHQGGPFSHHDERRLEMLAAQSAIALDNARLFREVLDERNYSENVLRSLTNGVLTFDNNLNVVKINEAAARILNRPAVRILGAHASKLFTDKNHWIVDSLSKVAASGQPYQSPDAEISNASGEIISVNVNFSPLIDSTAEPIGTTLVLEDVTNEKRVRSTMARYMTREVAEQVLEQGESVLGGRSQLATIVFTDIKDFTTLTERIGAQDTVRLLNEYFSEMVEIVFAHHGILDKYIGDAIMAVFGAPFQTPNDADNALGMALQMQQTLKRFNERRSQDGLPLINVRIGINSDQVVAGNIGSSRRMDYTVIGDGVNLAARLESANKHLGTELLISGMTAKLLQERYTMRELDLIRVKGKRAPVPIYEVLGRADEPMPEIRTRLLSRFARGMTAYRHRSWADAVREFGAALDIAPGDVPSRLFKHRAETYAATPPADDWDGVWTLYEK